MSPKPKLYRLHIDEVGNHDMGPSIHQNERFLSLTGVIIEQEHCRTEGAFWINDVRSMFEWPDGRPVTLHRHEIVWKKPPFTRLVDDMVRYEFNGRLIRALNRVEYTVITVIIDKRDHVERYKVWQWPPYHYCLVAVLERYLTFLGRRGARGDVVVEARGKHEDRRLKDAFAHAWKHGTGFVKASTFQSRLTSREVKLSPKAANDPGLQLADLIAAPSHRSMLVEAGLAEAPGRLHFDPHIMEILYRSKYDRKGAAGAIDGIGRKWLPV